MEAEILASW